MMDSSPHNKSAEPSLPPPAPPAAAPTTSLAGSKRPAPSLLPPFEPLSSSPGLPRPTKRQALDGSFAASTAYLKYPTPIPTSSTGILSSSPPGIHAARPTLARTQSALSERAPLSAVPSIELNENGDTLLLGRSSNSSNYQLSANRLVSRVHVKARYIPPTSSPQLAPGKIEIQCNGWNGLKLHCQSRTYELWKGDTFTSESEGTDMMLDVHDARVLIQWPKKDGLANLSDSSWDDSPRSRVGGARADSCCLLQSSPLRRATRLASPESPTPAASNHLSSSQRLQALLPLAAGDETVPIYEDASCDEQDLPKPSVEEELDPNRSHATEVTNSFSSDLSDPDDNDPDEENDPIVHSFGPFGANISSRLASIHTSSPKLTRSPKKAQRLPAVDESTVAPTLATTATDEAGDETASEHSAEQQQQQQQKTLAPASPLPPPTFDLPEVSEHVINQLAYSRLSSTPLSTIMQHLPAEEQDKVDGEGLRTLIRATACIGVITRQGKDAAGKPLESEYYYVPEMDTDQNRRAAVVDGLRKPSLRNCRKQHKQYYWKRPKTP